jgi:hypothetical protein
MARALVERGLAACAQISKIQSIYTWKGAIELGKEYRVLFQTAAERYDAVERAIRVLRASGDSRFRLRTHQRALRRVDREQLTLTEHHCILALGFSSSRKAATMAGWGWRIGGRD